MLGTKYVSDKFAMLVADLIVFVTNITHIYHKRLTSLNCTQYRCDPTKSLIAESDVDDKNIVRRQ